MCLPGLPEPLTEELCIRIIEFLDYIGISEIIQNLRTTWTSRCGYSESRKFFSVRGKISKGRFRLGPKHSAFVTNSIQISSAHYDVCAIE